jgi:hypothetical protein
MFLICGEVTLEQRQQILALLGEGGQCVVLDGSQAETARHWLEKDKGDEHVQEKS